jgi:hypothetical protein
MSTILDATRGRQSCGRCGFAVDVQSFRTLAILDEHLYDCPRRVSKTELREVRAANKRDAFFARKAAA